MRSGIYKIVNIINGKLYVGSSVNIENKRWPEHRRMLDKGEHHSIRLQRAWNKYREENFSFEIIEECEPVKEILKEREQLWMDHYQSYDPNKGYNVRIIADSCLGVKRSIETRKRISENHADLSGENHPNFGKHLSEETRGKIGEGNRGKIRSEQTKQKMSETFKGENNPGAILNRDQVHEIRLRYKEEKISTKELANEYGVSRTCILRIINNHTWEEEGVEITIKDNRGENHYNTILNLEQVHEIRQRYKEGNITQQKLANEYGVSRTCILRIINFRTWKEPPS